MKLKYLNDYDGFLNEAKDMQSDLKIIVLSNVSSKSYTIPALEEELKKRKIVYRVIDINTCRLKQKKDNTGDFEISDGKNKPFTINSDDTAVLTRRGVIRNTVTQDLVAKLEENNFFVVNTLESILACENKFTTSKMLADAGVPIPKMALIENVDRIDDAVKEIGGSFPVVLKLLSGSHGIGVSIIESLASLKSVLQTLWKVNDGIEVMIQEKIDAEYDLRIHVLTKKFNAPYPEETDSIILGAMQRNKVDEDFRTNYSLGGTVQKVDITDEQEQIAIDAAKAIGCNWCGVDIIVDKKSGKNYVLEVNSSPGTQGLKKATGIDVVSDIIDFIQDKENWVKSRITIGYRETICIPGIGEIVAKFDTGNGAHACTITFDEIDIDEKKKIVKWKIKDKKHTHKIIGFSEPEVGDTIEKRPIVLLDIEFAGKVYQDVHVSLDNRATKSTKFLVNREFMERIGCSVNPSKTFMVSVAPHGYSPKETKSDPHGGIEFERKKSKGVKESEMFPNFDSFLNESI